MVLDNTWIDCADDPLVVRLIDIRESLKMSHIWRAPDWLVKIGVDYTVSIGSPLTTQERILFGLQSRHSWWIGQGLNSPIAGDSLLRRLPAADWRHTFEANNILQKPPSVRASGNNLRGGEIHSKRLVARSLGSLGDLGWIFLDDQVRHGMKRNKRRSEKMNRDIFC